MGKTKRITLCGSTRFKAEFEAINRQLTLEGNIVYSVCSFGHADSIEWTNEQKKLLDEVHKRKIDNSDGIFVIDVDGYIGDSTRSEIDYAEYNGKFVKYLSDFPDLKYISDAAMTATARTEQLQKRVDAMAELLRMADCPESLIESPNSINHQEPSEETKQWASDCIKADRAKYNNGWTIFNKDDKTTWPKQDQIVLCAKIDDFFTDIYTFSNGKFTGWSYPHPELMVTHWIAHPQPPITPPKQ